MPYSASPSIVYSRMYLLQELNQGRSCRWTTSGSTLAETQVLARKIREALYAAKKNPDLFPVLARIHDTMSIYVIGAGIIEAKPKQGAVVEALTKVEPTGRITSGGDPWSGGEKAEWGKRPATVGVSTAAEVIEAWQRHLPSSDPVHFQQSYLPVEELTALYQWAKGEGHPTLMLLVGEGFLTVSLLEAGMEEYSWHPPKSPPKPERDYDV